MAAFKTCDVCGNRAIIQIRNVLAGKVCVRYLCLECAEDEDEAAPVRRQVNLGVVLMTTGLYVAVVSVFADKLGFGSADEFGWQQWTGLGISGICVLAGGIVRVPTLLAAGVLLGLTTLAADWLGLGNEPGFGWQQILGTFLGVSLLALGLAFLRWVSRERNDSNPDSMGLIGAGNGLADRVPNRRIRGVR